MPNRIHQCRRHVGHTAVQNFMNVTPRFLAESGVPANKRVVVMRAGIDHGFFNLIVGQIRIVSRAVEGKLHDQHARQAKLPAEFMDLGGDRSQVLSDEVAPLATRTQRRQ